MRITPPPGDAVLDVAAAASWLVCGKICVPEEAVSPESAGRRRDARCRRAPVRRRRCALPRPGPFAASVATATGRFGWLGRACRRPPFRAPGSIRSRGGEIDQNTPQPLTVDQGG